MNVRPVGVGVLAAPTATVHVPVVRPALRRVSRRALRSTLTTCELRAVWNLPPLVGIPPVARFGRLGRSTRCHPGLVSTTGTHVGLPSCELGSVATGGPPAWADPGTGEVGCTTVPSLSA